VLWLDDITTYTTGLDTVVRACKDMPGRDSLSWPHRDGLKWLHQDEVSALL
jgi:hypothetical protein